MPHLNARVESKALAKRLAGELAGEGFADHSAGLFLAATPGSGKTTFLKDRLIPECHRRGWLPMYLDLDGDNAPDIAELIAGSLAVEFQRLGPFAVQSAREATLRAVSLDWHIATSSLPQGWTLTRALDALHELSGQLLVLIIDEAQHASNSVSGLNTMFALKAARDHLNKGTGPDGLRLIFAGAGRGTLNPLLSNRSRPFFGASITEFEALARQAC